jgi:hypothetical protein
MMFRGNPSKALFAGRLSVDRMPELDAIFDPPNIESFGSWISSAFGIEIPSAVCCVCLEEFHLALARG